MSMNFAKPPVTVNNMWRVIFFERAGLRVVIDRSGPWLASKNLADGWAAWFENLGYCVALQNQQNIIERRFVGFPL